MTSRRWLLWGLFLVLVPMLQAQEGVRDDSHVENVVRQAVADEFSSEILTNRTRAYLSCESGEMIVKINFSEPFRGVTYSDYDRTSPCKFFGDGSRYYELRIPLQGCGTKREAPRLFINNIIVRFHPTLELEEDEIKTIICRYPPPLAPPPNNVVAPVLEPTPPLPAQLPPKLSEIELLLIICALLFLTLLLLGIGIAYYCLKKRNIKLVRRKKAASSAPGSEITKLSGSTMGTLSMFDPIRIPRAIAPSTSGSEAALLTSRSSQNGSGDRSDTIPSDYPSESPSSVNSDVEELDGRRSVLVSETSTYRTDHFRYENAAFVPEGYPTDKEREDSVQSVPVMAMIKPPPEPQRELLVRKEPKPKVAKEKMLTTILEREDYLHTEARDSVQATVSTTRRDLYAPAPKHTVQTRIRREREPPPPSLYGSIPDNDDRSQVEVVEEIPTRGPRSVSSYAPSLYGSIPDNDNWSHSEMVAEPPVRPYVRKPKIQMATLTDYLIDTQTSSDIKEDTTRTRQATYPAVRLPEDMRSVQEVTEPVDTRAVVPKRPRITVKNIDDVFVTTTTEVDATEHITKHTRDVVEQHKKISPPSPPAPPSPPSWDVTIRHRSPLTDGTEDTTRRTWDAISEASEKYRESTMTQRPSPPKPPTDWDVLIRVLHPPTTEGVEELTVEDQEKWQSIIRSDTTFRSLVREATSTEELFRISRDQRYQTLFEPRKWEVIIRILTAPDYRPASPETRPRYKKKSDTEQRRRGILPPSAHDPDPSRLSPGSVRSRRTSRSGDFDMRSMTEEEVDFGRVDGESLWSTDTGYTFRTAHSVTERSTSEFLEEVPRRNSPPRPRPERSHSESEDPYPATSMPRRSVPMHRSSPDFLADDPVIMPEVHHRQVRGRSVQERSSSEIILNSPILRAVDRASTYGEREEIKSVTETDVYDWKR